MTSLRDEKTHDEALKSAVGALQKAKNNGYGLLILTGAGMSVTSGVPVFRNANGEMSKDFLAFLSGYNKARVDHGLSPANDWFDFSVPEMFRSETAREAWAYWRWRILRARVPPGKDYEHLASIIENFGSENTFVVTSNCDGLHMSAGLSPDRLQEIHGSLSRVQCSGPCSNQLWPVDETFLSRLEKEPDWVPACPKCQHCCLRPNVMIFGDWDLVFDELEEQNRRCQEFLDQCKEEWIVLEIGAGTVVASIRHEAEILGKKGSGGLVRINPSRDECYDMSKGSMSVTSHKYHPIVAKSADALKDLAEALSPVKDSS